LIGLETYERDRTLAAKLGDEHLVVPSDAECAHLVQEHLVAAAGIGVESVDCLHARWKPGKSLSATWEVKLSDGNRRVVCTKLHADKSQPKTAGYSRPNDYTSTAAAPLHPFALAQDGAVTLTCFPADRVLRGGARIMDVRRTARLLDDAQIWSPWVVRRRASELKLLRYKPERRALYRMSVRYKLRGDPAAARDKDVDEVGGKDRHLAIRVLPAEHWNDMIVVRMKVPIGLGPELVHADSGTASFFEEWLEGEAFGSVEFQHAEAAGRLLAPLHGVKLQRKHSDRDRDSLMLYWARIASVCEELPELAAAPLLQGGRLIHGDFHPNQFLQSDHGLRLLDYDELRSGDPEEDLANWIADALAHVPDQSFGNASELLLKGYRSAGGEVVMARLLECVCFELGSRAIASVRRLEHGAIKRAQVLLERAALLAQEATPE
jgi:hypothetical protein